MSNKLKKMKMKKLFLFALATAMMSFAGCQEMEQEAPVNPNEGGSTFEFVADIAQTKTTLDVANGYKVDWEEGDIIYMVTSDGTWGKPYSDDEDAATIADFTYVDGKFTSAATIADGEYTFKGMYAAASQKSFHRGASSTHKLEATQTQNCAEPTEHIKANDALVGTFTATVPMTEMAKMNMAHLYTLMQVNVKNATGADVEVTKFEMTAADADLAGIFNVTAFDDTPEISIKSGASETITVDVTNGAVAAGGSLPIYFVMAPIADYSGDVTFKVTDSEGNTYSKTVAMNGISFEAGKYNTTPYTISTADEVATEVYGLVEVDGAFEDGGKYVLAFKDGKDGTYAFINSNGTSGTAVKNALIVTDNEITNPSTDYVFTAVASGDGFKFMNADGNYIYYSGSGTALNTTNSEASVWTPSFLSASGTYQLLYSAKRYIAFNGTDKAMSYAISNFKDQVANGIALAQYAGAISVFKLGYVPVIVPRIVVAELEKVALADAESIEIPYTTDNVSGAITATVTSDEDGMVKGTPVVESERVIVNLNVNDSENVKTATVTLSYEGAEDVIVTISQYAAASVDSGLVSLYENVKSTDSSSPDEFVVSVSNAIVTYVSGNTAFIEDETAGMLIYMSSHGLAAGDVLNGTLTGKAYVRYGVCQIVDFDYDGDKTKGTVPVTTVTVAELLENYDSYVSRRVKIENATVTDAVSGTSDRNGSISQNENSVNLYNNASSVSFVKDDVVDIYAYPSYYNSTKQLATYEAPVSKKVTAPSISCSNNEVTITCVTTGVTIYYSIDYAEYSEYEEPFKIDADCTVKAYAKKDGLIDSEVVTADLTWVDPDAETQPTTISRKIADIAEENNWSNSKQYKTIALDGVITVKADGGNNTGKYYTSGTNWRIYQTENPSLEISAIDGYTIKTVTITYGVSNTGVLTLDGSNVTSGTEVTVNADSVTFGVGNTGTATNGQVRVTEIKVVYQAI